LSPHSGDSRALSRRDCDRRRNAERRGIAIYRLDARRAARRFDQVIRGSTRRFLVRYPSEFGGTDGAARLHDSVEIVTARDTAAGASTPSNALLISAMREWPRCCDVTMIEYALHDWNVYSTHPGVLFFLRRCGQAANRRDVLSN